MVDKQTMHTLNGKASRVVEVAQAPNETLLAHNNIKTLVSIVYKHGAREIIRKHAPGGAQFAWLGHTGGMPD